MVKATLREISDWLNLLGLIVLASEGILVTAYNATEQILAFLSTASPIDLRSEITPWRKCARTSLQD